VLEYIDGQAAHGPLPPDQALRLAIQIASALAWRSDMFVSADARQCAAARASGLSVVKL